MPTTFTGTSTITGPDIWVDFRIVNDDGLGDAPVDGPSLGTVPVGSDGSWAIVFDEAPDPDLLWEHSDFYFFDGEGGALTIVPILFRDVDGDHERSSNDHTLDASVDRWLFYIDWTNDETWSPGWTLAQPNWEPNAGMPVEMSPAPIDFTERWVPQPLSAQIEWTGTETSDLRMVAFEFFILSVGIDFSSGGQLLSEPVFDMPFEDNRVSIEFPETPNLWREGVSPENEVYYAGVLPIVYIDENQDGEYSLEEVFQDLGSPTACSADRPASFWHFGYPWTFKEMYWMSVESFSPGWYLNEATGPTSSAWMEWPTLSSADPLALTSNPQTCDYVHVAP